MESIKTMRVWKSLLTAIFTLAFAASFMSAVAFADEYSISTDKAVYEIGEPIMVTATVDPAPANKQWVGIYKVSDGDVYGVDDNKPSFYWCYVTTENNGVATELTAAKNSNSRAGWEAGDYRIVLFADGGYTVAKTVDIKLKNVAGSEYASVEEANASYVLSTDKNEYRVGEAINVTASALRTGESDAPWVGIYKSDDALDGSSAISYFWYNLDAVTGWHGFDGSVKSGEAVDILSTASNWRENKHHYKIYAGTPLDPGSYVIVLYAQGTYNVQKTVTITVTRGDKNSIALQNELLETGSSSGENEKSSKKLSIPVVANVEGIGSEWVGIYKASDIPGTDDSIAWFYVDAVTAGKAIDLAGADVKFTDPLNIDGAGFEVVKKNYENYEWTPGDYKVILFRGDGDDGYGEQLADLHFAIRAHTYTSVEVKTRATEEDYGTGIYTCETCGNTYEGRIYYDVQRCEDAVSALGEVTLDKAQAVADAREAYNAVADARKSLVQASTVAALTDAEATIAKLQEEAVSKAAADAVAQKIEALGDISSLAQANDVKAAQAAYAALTDEQKAFVDPAVLNKLNAAGDAIAKLKQKAADDKAAAEKKAEAAKKTVTVNVSKVTASAVKKAVSKAKSSSKKVTTIVLGSKVKTVSKKAFAKYGKVKTIVVKTKKLTAKSVKGSLTGSKVTKVTVSIGSKSTNKKYVKNYKKVFAKKNCGRSVKVA